MASLQDRVMGAMRLQAKTFEDVEHDASATPQAAMVVVAVAVSGALGSFGSIGIGGALAMVVFQLIGWVLGSFVVLIVGTKIFPGKNTEADLGQMLRTMGFAQSPGIFNVLTGIPLLGWLVWVVIQIWVIVAMVIAVRQALDYDDTLKAVIVCVVAWVIMFMFMMLAALVGLGGAFAGGML
jgi:Yip1 domain